jgi:hypothetical protein
MLILMVTIPAGGLEGCEVACPKIEKLNARINKKIIVPFRR